MSAYVLYDYQNRGLDHKGWKGKSHGKLPNADLLDMVQTRGKHGDRGTELVIEMIASYGMPVGAEVFETCLVIGQIKRAWEWETMRSATLLYRRHVKQHLCGSMKAKDSNIRQALIDAWGGKAKAIGSKLAPGPLYGIKADTWAALAVAVTYADRREQAEAA